MQHQEEYNIHPVSHNTQTLPLMYSRRFRFPPSVTRGITVHVLLRWSGTSWTVTAMDCKCHGILTVNESHQLNMTMYERNILKYANPSDAPVAAPRGPCICYRVCFTHSPLASIQSCSVCFVLTCNCVKVN